MCLQIDTLKALSFCVHPYLQFPLYWVQLNNADDMAATYCHLKEDAKVETAESSVA